MQFNHHLTLNSCSLEQNKYISKNADITVWPGQGRVSAAASPRLTLLLYGCSSDFQDEKEDLNDVDVEGEGSVDVLLRAES